MGEMEERGFVALLDKVRRERGLDCRQYKVNFLKRRLAVRLRARGVESYREYARLLDDKEYDKLFETLTINLSYFFRGGTPFEALRAKVLKPLLQEKERQGNRPIRIWSAGCASGEEPYSVAVLFHGLPGKHLKDWQIRIHATDLDAGALEKARRGVYGEFSFRGVNPKYIAQYFAPLSQSEYAVRPETAALVKFERRDLIADPPLRRLDLILCRNVMIYFSREWQRRLLTTFHRALCDGGLPGHRQDGGADGSYCPAIQASRHEGAHLRQGGGLIVNPIAFLRNPMYNIAHQVF